MVRGRDSPGKGYPTMGYRENRMHDVFVAISRRIICEMDSSIHCIFQRKGFPTYWLLSSVSWGEFFLTQSKGVHGHIPKACKVMLFGQAGEKMDIEHVFPAG